jgi:putative colanic acid biosynthesis acetyltransferase WcaF
MQKTNLSNYHAHNTWYQPGSKFKQVLWFLASNTFINNYVPFPVFIKVFVLRLFGAKIGEKAMIKPNVNIKYPWYLTIGDYSWIGENVWIDNLDEVTIGSHVCISQGAMLLTGNHDYSKTTFNLMIDKIVLEDGVWIGAKAIVCGGVTCRSHSVLSVGSMTSKDLEPYRVYHGNPAVLIRTREIIK